MSAAQLLPRFRALVVRALPHRGQVLARAFPAAAAPSPPPFWLQCRAMASGPTIPRWAITKRTSRSSGAGGQSVNTADTRVQLSINLHDADFLSKEVREKMFLLYKNRINKKGDFQVACQVTASQIVNNRMAYKMLQDHIKKAELAVTDDEFAKKRVDNKKWILMKKVKQGREKEIEAHQAAIRRQKQYSRERTRNKRIRMY
eukprot:NODE_15195_length_1063_cov_3.291667.p1 GENE.NODE_15195_length_1063_cov_3.291667~~NODE_15195_length_1063_cov_3.291667.p1  ORF type:complete len:202 (-),score=58.00 NODE_15195_length_1063_cov_3.291667:307-912(-)